MRRMITLMAVLVLAACDSATGANQAVQDDRPAKAPGGASFSGGSAGAAHRAVIASVRKTGSGQYTAQGLAVDGDGVTIEVRSSTTGFSTTTSGTLVTYGNSTTGEVSVNFSASSGTRYLVVAYPSSSGGSLVDTTHPHFIEAVP
jgi:hypothetical protein